MNSTLPIHSLSQSGNSISIQPIEYQNPYDFTREHRHTYFEIFFFIKGGGVQLIDFREFPVRDFSCYIVFPQQIHLLRRNPEAHGLLIQFGEESIASVNARIALQKHSFTEDAAILFEDSREKITEFNTLLSIIDKTIQKASAHSNDIALNLLQGLLLQLMDESPNAERTVVSADRKLLFQFQQMLEEQYRENHNVSRYASALSTTDKKLSSVTKQFLGLSALQVIHNRILLEAKRMLLFDDVSNKEMSFLLGFDSPASFSLFIKNKTGFSPTDLASELSKINK